MKKYLSPNLSFYIDDAHRAGEKKVIQQRDTHYKLKFKKVHPVFSHAINGRAESNSLALLMLKALACSKFPNENSTYIGAIA